jgi:hypothetical protein
MMGTQRFQLDPAAFRKAADKTRSVSDRINQVWTDLDAGTSGLGSPWGTDKTGEQFAKGPHGNDGYESTKENVRNGITGPQGYVASLNNLAKGEDDTADYIEKQIEKANTDATTARQ